MRGFDLGLASGEDQTIKDNRGGSGVKIGRRARGRADFELSKQGKQFQPE